jgi:hypothetical protein
VLGYEKLADIGVLAAALATARRGRAKVAVIPRLPKAEPGNQKLGLG